MAKTGLINSEWENQFAYEAANFTIADVGRQNVSEHKEREVIVKKISDLFDEAIADGDHAGVLNLDKLTAFVKDA